jgi:ribosomal protein S12 methylthiotransferase
MVGVGSCSRGDFSFVSLGCPKNLVDSEKMLGLLAETGWLPVSYDPAGRGASAGPTRSSSTPAASSKRPRTNRWASSRKRSAKEAGKVKRVVVAGCLVQRHRAKMLEWAPGIDAMVGVFDRDKIVEAVRGTGPPPSASIVAPTKDKPKYWIAGQRARGRQDAA